MQFKGTPEKERLLLPKEEPAGPDEEQKVGKTSIVTTQEQQLMLTG